MNISNMKANSGPEEIKSGVIRDKMKVKDDWKQERKIFGGNF